MVKFQIEHPVLFGVALFAVAAVLRLAFHRTFFPDLEGIFDSYRRLLISESIARAGFGDAFGSESWRLLWVWLPLPFYFNALVAGITEQHRILLPLLYIAASSGSTLVLYYCGKKIWDANTGVIAWALVAFSPFHIAYSSTLLSETLMIFLLACSFLFALATSERPTVSVVVSGLLLGAAMLTRFETWILFPLYAVWVMRRLRTRPVIAGITIASSFLAPALYLFKIYLVYGEILAFRGMLGAYTKAIVDMPISGWIESLPGAVTGFFLLLIPGLHVLPAAFPALVRHFRERKQRSEQENLAIALPTILLLFVCFSFFTHNAAGYARYGLAPMFFLALPAAIGWNRGRLWLTALGFALAIMTLTLSVGWGESDTELCIAEKLASDTTAIGRIYCESPIAQVESRLPPERFAVQTQLSETTIVQYLDSLRITRIVTLENENSITQLISRLKNSGKFSGLASVSISDSAHGPAFKRSIRSIIYLINSMLPGAFRERKVYLYSYRPEHQ